MPLLGHGQDHTREFLPHFVQDIAVFRREEDLFVAVLLNPLPDQRNHVLYPCMHGFRSLFAGDVIRPSHQHTKDLASAEHRLRVLFHIRPEFVAQDAQVITGRILEAQPGQIEIRNVIHKGCIVFRRIFRLEGDVEILPEHPVRITGAARLQVSLPAFQGRQVGRHGHGGKNAADPFRLKKSDLQVFDLLAPGKRLPEEQVLEDGGGAETGPVPFRVSEIHGIAGEPEGIRGGLLRQFRHNVQALCIPDEPPDPLIRAPNFHIGMLQGEPGSHNAVLVRRFNLYTAELFQEGQADISCVLLVIVEEGSIQVAVLRDLHDQRIHLPGEQVHVLRINQVVFRDVGTGHMETGFPLFDQLQGIVKYLLPVRQFGARVAASLREIKHGVPASFVPAVAGVLPRSASGGSGLRRSSGWLPGQNTGR